MPSDFQSRIHPSSELLQWGSIFHVAMPKSIVYYSILQAAGCSPQCQSMYARTGSALLFCLQLIGNLQWAGLYCSIGNHVVGCS